MIVRLFRTGGLPPAANEKVVTVDDGRLAVWRSTGVQVAGSFTGQLEKAESDAIQTLARQCVEAGELPQAAAPDAAFDTVTLDAARAEVGQHDRPDGPWGDLLDRLRPLLDRTDRPYATIGLDISASGTRARLRHLGEAPIRVDLSTLRVDGAALPSGAGVVEASPGWSHEVPLAAADESRSVRGLRVSVVIYDREHPVEAELTATSDRPLREA